MAATPKLSLAMMQGGGVYDSIIGQTQTPRANEKVLMFLDRMAPSDPVDNVVVWTDDEEPADHRVHMLLPDHRRKPHKPSSLSIENEEILDELAQSEMSYPHDDHVKKASGPRRSADDRHHREANLDDFGPRGWTASEKPMSPPEHAFAMPSARPAGAHSRQGSRVPSRMDQRRPGSAVPSRPASVRPAPNQANNGDNGNGHGNPNNATLNFSPPVALEIDIREPSVDATSPDKYGVRSLPETEADLYAAAAGNTTPRVVSPPPAQPSFFSRRGDGNVAPLKSPFKTPQAMAANVALPGSRAPSSIGGGSRPASRMAAQIVRGEDLVQPQPRASNEPMTAAAFETPWFHRTQYGKQEPPTVVSTLRLKLVSPPPAAPNPARVPAADPYSTPKLVISHDVQSRVPKSRIKTPVVSNVEAAPYDGHVQGHVHEVVEQDPDVVVVREEDEYDGEHGDIEGDDIRHHVQEHYDVVGGGTQRSTTPKARDLALRAVEYPETEVVDVEAMNERQLVELLKTPAMRSDALDYSDAAKRALEMHHDEDLCVLLQAADDELQHPVVRKAVRKQIAARLRKLGLADDYEAVKRDPNMAARLHREAYGSPRSMLDRRLPDDAPQWARILSDHVRELTRQMQSSQINEKGKPRLIKGKEGNQSPTRDYEEDSLHPGHAIDEGGVQYHPDTEADTEGLLNIEPPAAGLVSPGEILYDEEVYKLRKRNAQGSPRSHATWEIEEEMARGGGASVLAGEENALPEIPGSDYYRSSPTKGHRRHDSASQTGGNETTHGADNEGLDWVARYSQQPNEPPPWLQVNQRLLNWAIIWPFSEIENSLKSCERGEQVDEVALTIWTAQIYKRYVRAQMTQFPPQTVDKMFVPPNIADAINNAAYNGRHEEVAMMLKELWAPFGFKGHPKLILALTKHRREENHWVVHRFSLPDASIITYDTHLEKSLPDGRPLGWWFGIRIAFASDKYPPPDQVVQRMIRLHRPLQLQVDNSVSAAAIWRNLIMGTKADRLVDLERLRDLVRQEVKGIRGKKEQGKLSLGLPKATWSANQRAIEA